MTDALNYGKVVRWNWNTVWQDARGANSAPFAPLGLFKPRLCSLEMGAGGTVCCFAEEAGKRIFLPSAFGAYWYWSKIFMHRDHDIFVRAIKDKRKVRLVFLSNTDGNNAEKLCGPMLYSPPAPAGESDWYYLWDFEGSSDKRVLGFPSNKIMSMELTEEAFDPKDFTTYERD